MRKNKILILALLVCLSIPVRAQNTDNNIIGIVVDKSGNPVYGASVNVEGGAVETRVETDKDGKFEIAVEKGQRLSVVSVDKGSTTVVAKTDGPMTIVMGYAAQTIDVGANRTFSRHESTAAVSTTYNEEFNKRSSRNISNSLYGYGLGLTTLQNAASTGLMADPTFYVRGLQSLSSSTPLVLVDGLERDMSLVSPEEVESVSILKDAAAVALYGYKGVNGAILITTKRGKYKTKEITFTYDHIINTQSRRPEFVDAATYASAVNEAARVLGTFDLSGCEIYTSCEPCPMCLGAIYWAHLDKVYYGNTKADAKEIGFDDSFIYDELALPLEKRHLNVVPMMRDEAIKAFEKWENKSDKIEY